VSQDTSVREPGEQSLPGRCSGFGVLSGAAWARWLGILIATISVSVNFTFIPFEPWWALAIIFIDLWVIHPLFVHRRLRD
jgi:hypothetical protein